jgi:hypothetical protein
MSEPAARKSEVGRVFDAAGLRPSELAVGAPGGARSLDVTALADGTHHWNGHAFTVERGGLGAQFLPPSLIACVHVPRAGGTTFRRWLAQEWGDRLVLDYADQPLSSDYAARVRQARSGPGLFLPASARAVHGHFLASKYQAAAPRLAIWLREPAARAASHWRFWRDSAGDHDPNLTKRRFVEQGLDLAGFAEMPELQDVHARFMDGVPLTAFAFVGVFAQLARGVRLFARMFGLAEPAALPVVNAASVDAEPLSPALRGRLAELNRRDVELYAAAVERFEALCRAHGV